jgi:hypothetical protein
MRQSPLLVPQSSSIALPTVNPEKSLFIGSHLRVDDAIVGTGGEHNHPGIAPLGFS